jgi:hypothetical protein
MRDIDYSFETQIKHASANFEEAFEQAYGMTIEEARKDPEFVKQYDAQLRRNMWNLGTSPSPFGS